MVFTPLHSVNQEYVPWIEQVCELYSVPVDVALAVGIIESKLTMINSGRNKDGSYDIGVFQINSRYKDWHEQKLWQKGRKFNINDAHDNIEMGILILRYQYENTGDWHLAVRAYNTGLKALRKYPERSLPYLRKFKRANYVVKATRLFGASSYRTDNLSTISYLMKLSM